MRLECELYMLEFDPPIEIAGSGDSLWTLRVDKDSGGPFHVSKATLDFCAFGDGGGCWSLECFGPDLFWEVYTDNGVKAEVMAKIAPRFLAKGLTITSLGWSEQGMQPEDGWNFDADVVDAN
jgi:hypothetical protein